MGDVNGEYSMGSCGRRSWGIQLRVTRLGKELLTDKVWLLGDSDILV